MTPSTRSFPPDPMAWLPKVVGALVPLVLVAIFAGPAFGRDEPTGVTGVEATAKSQNSITIRWNPEPGATGYKISRNNRVIATIGAGATTHVDEGLATGTAYSYEVAAIAADGTRSDDNKVLTVFTNGLSGIGRTSVVDLRHTLLTSERVVMTWTPIPGAIGYKVLRDGSTIATKGAADFWHTDAQLAEATTYTYEVAAVRADGSRSPDNGAMTITTRRYAAPAPVPAPAPAPPAGGGGGGSTTVLAVGDIANCQGREADVARVLRQRSGDIVLLGDIAYPNGSAAEFANCFDPHFGSMKSRMLPTPGNHEYRSTNAAPYFDYFGQRAGTRGQGWYSTDRGTWQIIMLNSNCSAVGGCTKASAQYRWLEAELRTRPNACRLVGWHHPRRTSFSADGRLRQLDPIFNLLYEHGTDLLLAGHGHAYERFEPQGPDGSAQPGRGVAQFVIGTGGVPLRDAVSPISGSVVRNNKTWGVVEFTLGENSYDHRFITAAGQGFEDSGSRSCNNR